MANSQTTKDLLAQSVTRSLVAVLRTDLTAAWGSAVEVKETHPDFDYDRRPLADGTTEARDLTISPFVGVGEVATSNAPYGMSNKENRTAQTFILSILVLAKSHTDLKNLHRTLQSVLDGLDSGRGAYPLLDPSDDSDTGEEALLGDVVDGGVFGPGDEVERSAGPTAGKDLAQNLKHRARLALVVETYKRRGTSVS